MKKFLKRIKRDKKDKAEEAAEEGEELSYKYRYADNSDDEPVSDEEPEQEDEGANYLEVRFKVKVVRVSEVHYKHDGKNVFIRFRVKTAKRGKKGKTKGRKKHIFKETGVQTVEDSLAFWPRESPFDFFMTFRILEEEGKYSLEDKELWFSLLEDKSKEKDSDEDENGLRWSVV